MTDWDKRDLSADLSFLPAGDYTLELFSDGVNADKHGEDYIHRTLRFSSPGKVEINMAPGGGWVARITVTK
ncbi:MAG: glycoside hydrolase family 97 C-terminal domain-containing protein [Marinilabiliales bacterium]|nr:glycoside hydrolase family 97 C-terminal domain-containing protein [Marinilabiliales bacterium]